MLQNLLLISFGAHVARAIAPDEVTIMFQFHEPDEIAHLNSLEVTNTELSGSL
jgi:hypothetical protein